MKCPNCNHETKNYCVTTDLRRKCVECGADLKITKKVERDERVTYILNETELNEKGIRKSN